MRSRYCAYVLQDKSYLLSTWCEADRPKDIQFDDCRWLGLKVLSTRLGDEHDSEGWVSFVARYKIAGRAHRLEESSHFIRSNGLWMYHKAELRDEH